MIFMMRDPFRERAYPSPQGPGEPGRRKRSDEIQDPRDAFGRRPHFQLTAIIYVRCM